MAPDYENHRLIPVSFDTLNIIHLLELRLQESLQSCLVRVGNKSS